MIEHILVFDDEPRLWETCQRLLNEQITWVSNAGRRPGVLFSGGATFIPFYSLLSDVPADVFLVDERIVPEGTVADTASMLEREWFSRLVVPTGTLQRVQRQGDAATTADAYEQQLHAWASAGGVFAAALLGVGPDGHTGSLFPGQRSSWEGTDRWVVEAQGEQEPLVPRVSVTPTFLARIPRHIVVAMGSNKTTIIRSWLRDREPLPIQLVQPADERYILLDRAAARELDPSTFEAS